jgi:beta-phosphoglucomutase-like phosphatase (HAD superfamily)
VSARRFDLIIFDYDGVVADSELLNNAVLADLLTKAGLSTSLDEALAIYMGKRWLDCRPLIEARLGGPCPDDLQAEWMRQCYSRAPAELEPVAGFVEFLAGRNERRCIASSSPPDWIELGLRCFGVTGTFGGPIFSAAVHVTRGKPHPDLFLHAAEAMGADPARTLVIEDSEPGVLAGVAAGMTVVGLCAGGHIRRGHAERLRQAGAHHVAGDYGTIARMLDGAASL